MSTTAVGVSSQNHFEEAPTKIRDWMLLTRLLRLLLPYWIGVLASLFCSLAATFLQILNPLVFSVVIDVYFLHRPPHSQWLDRLLPHNALYGIELLSVVYLGVLTLSLVIETTQNFLAQWIGQLAMADLRKRLVEHLHGLPISYYDVTPAGRLVTRVTTDIESLSDLFSNGIVSILANVVMTLFFLAAMIRLNGHMAIVLGCILPVFVVLTTIFRRMITRSQQRVRILLARINAFIAEHVNGISVVHLFNRQRPSLADFDEINYAHMVASKEWVTANAWFLPSIEFLGTISQAGLLVTGAYLLQRGQLSIGTLVAFLQYGSRFLRPIQEISERYGVMQTSIVSAEKVFALLDTEAQKKEENTQPWQGTNSSIEFSGVWFSYKPDRWILRDVNFTIGSGEMLAIVGHTGAGKTTLSNLLLRFYEPQRGTIRVGGTDVRALHTGDLRRQFGVVLQDTYVREGTILDNIRFGSVELSDEDVLEAAKQIGLADAIQSLPDGLHTWIQERGDNLSGGQKQMIAFARALAHNPRFLLLDEATSNVDLETEARIRKALSRLLVNRTSIVIAHRLSTILTADKILVMHKGEIAEAGSHDELLKKQGLYWRLFQIQFGHQTAAQNAARSVTTEPGTPLRSDDGLTLQIS